MRIRDRFDAGQATALLKTIDPTPLVGTWHTTNSASDVLTTHP